MWTGPIELVDRSGQSLFELCSRLTLKHGIDSLRQVISQCLGVAEAARLIRTRREGRSKLHSFVGGTAEGCRGPNATDQSTSNPIEEDIQK